MQGTEISSTSGIPLVTVHLVVSQYARGRRAQAIADMSGLPVAEVARIGQQYGAPDLARLADAAELLRDELDKAEPSSPGSTARDGVGVLRREAERIGCTKLVQRADRIQQLLDQLRVDVTRESRLWDAKRAERVAQEAKRKRLAEIEAEAKAIRADLATRQRSIVTGEPQSALKSSAERGAIRTWAREHGYKVSDQGKIPGVVMAAYMARESA